VSKPVEEDAPTQIGPAPGMPTRGASSDFDTTLETQTEPVGHRDSRRPAKMGVFTLGPTEPKAPPPPRPVYDEGETSELSAVSRVSRGWTGLQPPARRGLWIVLAIVVLGLAVLLMPDAVKSRIGALFSSESAPGSTVPSRTAEPGSDAYEPPPPAEGSQTEEAPRKATAAPAAQGDAPRAPRARPPRSAPPSTIQGNPEGQAPKSPSEDPSAPAEPSQGPAEVDPSIQPLELAPPSTEGEEQ
jgi:hypothetical protein